MKTINRFGFLGALALSIAALSSSANAQQLAFPTAEGFGKYAVGGRGGDVYIVSNLNNSQTGSLRACIEASGPRTCVFTVSGEIRLQDALRVVNPYLTIAGQTAPGDGIQITNQNTSSDVYPLLIDTHDIIVRHIRVRPGPSQGLSSNIDAVLIEGQNIILDHVTMSWGTDEVLNIFGNGGTVGAALVPNASNITIQWSMIYEGLRIANHPKGKHSNNNYIGYGPRDITFHHNLMAHSTRRNPNLGVIGQFDFINNVTYNWDDYAAEIYTRHGSSYINWAGNMAIIGPNTKKDKRWVLNAFNNGDLGELQLFVSDNIDHNRPNASVDARETLDPKDWKYLSPTPVGYGAFSINSASVTGPQQAYRDVLAFAGATRPGRDTADARIVNEVQTCSGGIIDHPNERGGWPVLQSDPAPLDSDFDGMPDAWEGANGLNPNDPADRKGDQNGDGYTNLENYLNQLAGDDAGSPVGQGTGVDADPTCGYSLLIPRNVTINEFRIEPAAAQAGDTVTIYFDAIARSCKKSWNRNLSPFQLSGVDTITVNENTSLDFICTNKGLDDWENKIAFVTPDGELPTPSVALNADKATYSVGEEINLSWLVGRRRNNNAGICTASGLWSGFRSVIGAETVIAEQSGGFTLECEGPGGVGSDTVAITVNGAPPPPPPPPTNNPPTAIVSADTTSGDAPLNVAFSSAGSNDSDGQIVSYLWDFDSNGTTDATGAAANHTYTTNGIFTAQLTVIDDDGASDSATTVITVNQPSPPTNTPPTAVISAAPTSGDAPLSVAFSSAGSSDNDGQIVSYSWDFDGDGSPDANGGAANYTYTTAGSFAARLTVTDDDGASDSATTVITVNQPPPPNDPPTAIFSATPTSGDAPLAVAFNAGGSSDSDGQIVSYSWDFDDDGTADASGVTANYAYTAPGSFAARLTVTDNDGAQDSAITTITVNQPPPPPTPGFQIGAAIEITVSDRWRGLPGGGVRGDRLPVGATGVILDGPAVVNGETWWRIDAGNRQGWYLERNMTAI